MKEYLFAYGTLAEESAPPGIAGIIKRLRYISEGSVLGRLYDLGEYPGAVLDKNSSNKIFGRIYELPNGLELLNRLDAYEEFDPKHPAKSLFVRRRASITRADKKKVQGWVYEYNRDVGSRPLIKSGRYFLTAASTR